MTQRAIVVGASSGIGEALARSLASAGWAVGLAARRVDKLEALASELGTETQVQQLDVCETDALVPGEAPPAVRNLHTLIDKLGGADLIVVNAGIGLYNKRLDWDIERQVIDTNVRGFACMAGAAFNYFATRKSGHLVAISSINAVRGNLKAPSYGASKAFVTNYMDGLRARSNRWKLGVRTTDVLPGFVATPMTADNRKMFWCATAEEAARQIRKGVELGRSKIYVTRRWRWVALAMQLCPNWLYDRLF